MHARQLAVATMFAAVFWSPPARACERDPFLFQLPGETEAQAQARSKLIAADHIIAFRFNREKFAHEKASIIYLARVVSTSSRWTGPGLKPRRTLIDPVAAVKGTLPRGRRTLEDEGQGGTCSDYGDGLGSFSRAGAIVVVFEGLPKSRERPRGIDSFPADAIRTVPVLDALRNYGKDLED